MLAHVPYDTIQGMIRTKPRKISGCFERFASIRVDIIAGNHLTSFWFLDKTEWLSRSQHSVSCLPLFIPATIHASNPLEAASSLTQFGANHTLNCVTGNMCKHCSTECIDQALARLLCITGLA